MVESNAMEMCAQHERWLGYGGRRVERSYTMPHQSIALVVKVVNCVSMLTETDACSFKDLRGHRYLVGPHNIISKVRAESEDIATAGCL